jgi:hypothetical protein
MRTSRQRLDDLGEGPRSSVMPGRGSELASLTRLMDDAVAQSGGRFAIWKQSAELAGFPDETAPAAGVYPRRSRFPRASLHESN